MSEILPILQNPLYQGLRCTDFENFNIRIAYFSEKNRFGASCVEKPSYFRLLSTNGRVFSVQKIKKPKTMCIILGGFDFYRILRKRVLDP
jgi:hypothetical protein